MSAGDADEAGGFLTRWSRRKRGEKALSLSAHPEEPRSGVSKDAPVASAASPAILRDAVPKGTAPQDEGTEEQVRRGEADEPGAPLVEPPSLDLIDKDFDLAHWLKQGVPESWKLAAMRRAWVSDPQIRDYLDPARDYALDWNTPGGAPGYGPLTESDDVEAMLRGIFGDAPPVADPPPEVLAETGDSVSHRLSSYDETVNVDDAVRDEPSFVRRTEDGVEAKAPAGAPDYGRNAPSDAAATHAALQQASPDDPPPLRFRKRGGGAMPM